MAPVRLTFWRVSAVSVGAGARALRYRRRLLASGLCRPVHSSATGIRVPVQMQSCVGSRDACASALPRGRSVYIAAQCHVEGKEKEGVASKRTSETQNPPDDHPVFEKENIWTVPNVLSLGRIVLSPALGWLVLREDYQLAFTLLAIAAVSDVVDGQVARRFPGQASLLGSVLDPFADKCLVSILCVTLTIKGLIPLPLTALFLSRDILLIGASFYLRYTTLPHPRTWSRYWDIQRSTLQVIPTSLSKVNTLLQLLTVGLSLGAPLLNAAHHPALQLLWWCTGVTTVVSGASYIVKMRGFRILRNNRCRHKQT